VNEQEWAVLGQYIRGVANLMELRDWEFRLARDASENPDAQASVEPTYGQKHAVIRVCSDFRTLKPERQRHCIVHELIHCHLRDACDVIRCTLPNLLGRPTFDALWEPHRQQIEYATDALAAVIAPSVKLIDWDAATTEPEVGG
jgi:hypothetical protein